MADASEPTKTKEKPVRWIGRSRNDLRRFPDDVRRDIGFALDFAQRGVKHPSAKPLKGFGGAGVLEVVEDSRGDTYRAVYTVRFAEVVYVLHAFMKKSTSGIKTPKHEVNLIEQRLKVAEMDYKGMEKRSTLMKAHPAAMKPSSVEAVVPGGENVFADLGFPRKEAAELKVKAQLTLQIHQRIQELGLTQTRAAERLGLSQPDVSKLMGGRHTGYSVDRLLHLLNALEVDIDIVVRPKVHGRRAHRGIVRVLSSV